MTFLVIVGLLAAGGIATSVAEYRLRYNLVDLAIEKAKALFQKI